jgi:hypothetical protein
MSRTSGVPAHGSRDANASIREAMESDVRRVADSPDEIARRLAALGREWDIERALHVTASTLTLATLLLGLTVSRRWLAVPLAINGALLQHAVQGWCPPLPALRRLGFRTAREIEEERYALKVLRGDFQEGLHASTAPSSDVRTRYALAAVRR